VVFSPDGEKAFVSNSLDSSVTVINTKDLSTESELTMSSASSAPSRPDGILAPSGGKRLYVALFNEGFGAEVNVFSTVTSTLIKTIKVGDGPFAVAAVLPPAQTAP
jgi:YVTN family beta-propeller protein